MFIEGIKIINGAFWNVVPVYCDHVIVRGVEICSVGVGNGDGINIDSSKNVLVEYCSVKTGDDSYCLKAGRDKDGQRANRPVENVVQRFNLSLGGHGGITCGSETAGMIRNIHVANCRYENTMSGIRFKTRRPRAGGGENLTFENIYVKAGTIINCDMLGKPQWVGGLATRLPALEMTPQTPTYHDITIRSVVGVASNWILKADGIPESPLRNVLIENSDLTGPNGLKLTDAHDIVLRNCDIQCDADVLFDFRNVQKFQTPLCRIADGVTKTVQVAEATCDGIDLSKLKIGVVKVMAVEGANNSCVALPLNTVEN